MISGNLSGRERPGAAKRGAALLAGLARCRRCGQKMSVQYTGRDHDSRAMHAGAAGSTTASRAASRSAAFASMTRSKAELLRVLEPAAIEAALEADQEEARRRDEVLDALERDLEAARYAADKAFRQYDAADPANRLVAAELELRWNRALERVTELESRIEKHAGKTPATVPTSSEPFATLATNLKAIWRDPSD